MRRSSIENLINCIKTERFCLGLYCVCGNECGYLVGIWEYDDWYNILLVTDESGHAVIKYKAIDIPLNIVNFEDSITESEAMAIMNLNDAADDSTIIWGYGDSLFKNLID